MTLSVREREFKIGPYRVIRHIAQGGMGAVYEVEDPTKDGHFALKLGANDHGRDPRFLQIHRALSRVPHPGIVNSHAVGTTPDGRSFQLLDLIHGEPAQVFARSMGSPGSRVRSTAVITVAIHLAEALAHLHNHSIIHRDIKSSNVMVRQDHSACLIDFGAAILPGLPMRPGRFVGTYSYAAPEHIRGEPLDGRADVYSMGVLLHRMLSGRPPFAADTTKDLIHQHLHAPPPRLDASLLDLPSTVVELTLAMLEKDPAHRPNAQGVAQTLMQA